MIQFGNDKIKDIYVGSDKIERVYYGSELVWDIRGYWVHRSTGVKTYFGLDADFITDGIMDYRPSWADDCSEVKIPSGVTGLGNYCLNGSLYLSSITLPESLISLGNGCFQYCSSLTSIIIPSNVTNIGNWCFYECRSLRLATVLPATPPTLSTTTFYMVHTSFNIKVHSPYVNAYKAATNWTEHASVISAI